MKLVKLVRQYIIYRKSLGEKFKTNAGYLNLFVKSCGENKEIQKITAKQVLKFLYGERGEHFTSSWFIKHTALLGFYRYAFSRGYIHKIPLPQTLPKRPPSFVPYIYSREEIRLLLEATSYYQKNKSFVQPEMIRMILLLLYSTGLRANEALSLKMADVNLVQNLIKVSDTKFYKSRLIPIGDQLKQKMAGYLVWREKCQFSKDPSSPLFVSKDNIPFNLGTMRGIFKRLRKKAGIVRVDLARYQPRLHDFRHTFAVHRLISWYQQNKDVTKLLPILSTYMGHSHLAHTSVYLTMTTELLNEASQRFENYSLGEHS